MKQILLLLALVLVGCSNEDARSPVAPEMPNLPPVEPEPEPEPFNPGVQFSWENTRGIVLFAGTQGTEAQIIALNGDLRAKGWPTITYNVCSETTDWRGSPWAVGPDARSVENLDNLRRFLKVTAELGDQVRMNIFCTLRDNHAWMDLHYLEYTRTVAIIVKDFDHVSLSVANEAMHPGSYFKSWPVAIRRVRDEARQAGFQGLIGADDGLGCPDPKVCNFNYAYRHLGFIPDFHPFRSPDPGRGTLQALRSINGLPLILSETTCYSSWREDRLCTKSKERILQYMRRTERLGIVFFFHSTDGLQWPTVVSTFEWIPLQ